MCRMEEILNDKPNLELDQSAKTEIAEVDIEALEDRLMPICLCETI